MTGAAGKSSEHFKISCLFPLFMEIQVAKRTNFNAIYLSISDDKRGLVHKTLEEKGLMEIMDKILINGSLKNLARLMECGIRFQVNLA